MKFAKAAHAHNVPLIVDNTFPTPINCRPIEWGADIVTHSTTKYMDGHGAAVGGAIVDSGNFDWMAHADMYPGLCTPDESYHGITYAEKFGKEGAFITKCTSQLMRDLGCIQSPQNAFILNLGLESLHVRMPRHVENGQAVAEFLENHPKVEYVSYPGLKSNKYYETAKKYMPNGGCGVVSFEIKGGKEAAEKFLKNLKLAAIETHVADARTCCLNPATSTHRQLNDEQLKEAGVCKNFEDIGTYMWHGGAHHVGFDVHDVVEGSGLAVPGVVFCVDIGVYHEEWGIGFRLEDNCLITEDGCENLSRAIPRQIDEIEAFMGRR